MPTGTTPKRRGRPPKVEPSKSDHILEAALAAFATQGFDRANLRQIAATAGIDVAMIPHRFGSKLGLWQSVIDDVAERFFQNAGMGEENPKPSQGPREDLRRLIEERVDFLCDRPQIAMLMLMELAHLDKRFDYAFEQLVRPFHGFIVPQVRAAQADGVLADIDADFFDFILTGSIAMAIVLRPFIARFSSLAENDDQFRNELKHIFTSIIPEAIR